MRPFDCAISVRQFFQRNKVAPVGRCFPRFVRYRTLRCPREEGINRRVRFGAFSGSVAGHGHSIAGPAPEAIFGREVHMSKWVDANVVKLTQGEARRLARISRLGSDATEPDGPVV
jgi:hypothetical protein